MQEIERPSIDLNRVLPLWGKKRDGREEEFLFSLFTEF